LRQAYDYWQDQPDNYILGETLVSNPTPAIITHVRPPSDIQTADARGRYANPLSCWL